MWTGVPDGRQLPDGGMDRDLVEAAQRGDQEAFVDLVQLHGDRLYAIAHRILRDVDRAEDALQDALVIAWRDLPSLRDPDRFDAWLHRVLTNVCIGQATRERGRIAHLRALPVDDPRAPDDLLSVADRDELDRAFRRLRPDERAILVLHDFVGYPRRRSPSCSVFPEGRFARDFTMHIAPCAPPSMPRRACRSPEAPCERTLRDRTRLEYLVR